MTGVQAWGRDSPCCLLLPLSSSGPSLGSITLLRRRRDVGAVSYENLSVEVTQTQFIEDGSVPGDAKIVGYTWKYVNKDGGPDRRFKDNRKLPIALYQELEFSSATGLNEKFQFSDREVVKGFVEVLNAIAALPRVGNAQLENKPAAG